MMLEIPFSTRVNARLRWFGNPEGLQRRDFTTKSRIAQMIWQSLFEQKQKDRITKIKNKIDKKTWAIAEAPVTPARILSILSEKCLAFYASVTRLVTFSRERSKNIALKRHCNSSESRLFQISGKNEIFCPNPSFTVKG